ncbi:MAG: HAD family hydrolase [Candidatus Methylomirabilales bacterium]
MSQRFQSSRPIVDKTTWSAVLFDFGGTLDANGITWKERFFRLYRDEGVALSSEQFDPVFYRADDALVGAIPATLSLRDTVTRLAHDVTQGLGLQDVMLGERVAKRFMDEAQERISASVQLLGEISDRYRLGIVSNFYGNLATVCDEVGLSQFLMVAVDSAQVGYTKPDPHIFLLALAALKAEPTEAVFVGDSLQRDMAGARGVGMAHIWLTPETSAAAEACCPNDPVVHTLEGLREFLL